MTPETGFVGGHPCLDFLNTAGGRTKDRDHERLTDFPLAAGWAAKTGVIDRRERSVLDRAAADRPEDAAAALRALHRQREALHGFLVAAIQGVSPAPGIREQVESAIRDGHRHAHLSTSLEDHHAWTVEAAAAGLHLIGLRLAIATAALLSGPERGQISMCGRCSWLFLDPSPTRRRRWCSMAACGNRAKAQRHHERR